MTAIASYASFASLLAQADTLSIMKTGSANNANIMASYWILNQLQGVAPTSAVATTNATIGALNNVKDVTSASGSVYVGKIKSTNQNGGTSGIYVLYDRLSHQGGLDGTSTSAQTTNLPTAALTRYTSGAGVMIGLEIYTSIGSSGTTVTASYTNQAGTSGQTTKATAFGVASFNTSSRIIFLPLQDGDTGVKAVASVTLAQSSGTVGNFGVVLFKPLYCFLADVSHVPYVANMVPPLGGGFQFEPIVNGACLSLMACATGSFTGATIDFSFIKAT